MIIAELLGGR